LCQTGNSNRGSFGPPTFLPNFSSPISQGVKEMLTFFSKTFTKRTQPGQRQSVQHESYIVHCYVRADGLAGTVTTDLEYPPRVAFVLLTQLLEEYSNAVTDDVWKSCNTPESIPYPPLEEVRMDKKQSDSFQKTMVSRITLTMISCIALTTISCITLTPLRFVPRLTIACSNCSSQYLSKYQDPASADKITKIQKDLDDTTDILHKTIDNVLERGVKLDQLVERSDDLSRQSKMFYKQARKTNSCCTIS